jgi:uncharacterized protein
VSSLAKSSRSRLSKPVFPPYAHRPGKTPHPNQAGGHRYQWTEPQAQPLGLPPWPSHLNYLYGIDLLNHGYFWEAHVEFEAIWNAHGRQGIEAELMKALIKWAAAGVKAAIESRAAATGHLERALEILDPLNPQDAQSCTGLDLNQWKAQIHSLLEKQEFLNSEGLLPEITLSSS